MLSSVDERGRSTFYFIHKVSLLVKCSSLIYLFFFSFLTFLLSFFLYSGSTGKPKGVLHTTAGYLIYAATTFKYVFDYHPGDVYWCTADVGWITGHTYVVYGPLANGATSIIVGSKIFHLPVISSNNCP